MQFTHILNAVYYHTNNNLPHCSPISPIPFVLLSLISLISLTACQPVTWHEQYEPIEDPAVYAFVNQALAQAIQLYSQPQTPVSDIHIRRSIPRKNSALLSRADVNWLNLAKALYINRDQSSIATIWSDLPPDLQSAIQYSAFNPDTSLALTDQLNMLTHLNRLITTPSFHSTHKSSSKRELANRRHLAFLFPAAISPPPKLVSARRGFELCQYGDPNNGVFVLYVISPPDHPMFHLELAHEVLHILNPYFYDWYVEGLANNFAQHMAQLIDKPWHPWQTHFASRRHTDPYAIAYYMMRDIQSVAPQHMVSFIAYASWSNPRHTKMHINIDNWLANLPSDKRADVIAIINKYTHDLQQHQGSANAFHIPNSFR